jgi:hypothetical protein
LCGLGFDDFSAVSGGCTVSVVETSVGTTSINTPAIFALTAGSVPSGVTGVTVDVSTPLLWNGPSVADDNITRPDASLERLCSEVASNCVRGSSSAAVLLETVKGTAVVVSLLHLSIVILRVFFLPVFSR